MSRMFMSRKGEILNLKSDPHLPKKIFVSMIPLQK